MYNTNKKKRKLYIKELLICLACCVIPFLFGREHVQHLVYFESLFPTEKTENLVDSYDIHHGVSVVKYKEFSYNLDGGEYKLKCFDMPNGDTVVNAALFGKTENNIALESLEIKGDAIIHMYDQSRVEEALHEGEYHTSFFIIDSDDFDIACYCAKQYSFMENEALLYHPDKDGYLNVIKTDDGFKLEIISNAVDANTRSDILLIYSPGDLVEWSTKGGDPDTWLNYTLNGDTHWTYDGYYRISAANYIPTGENVYSRCPSCWQARTLLLQDPRSALMDDIVCCMIEISASLQNQDGYFYSTSGSEWLLGDYNVQAPYYDDRFNADLMESFILGYSLFNNSTAYKAMQKYVQFFKSYAAAYGRDDGNGGLWIPDYYSKGADMDKMHVSLNHHLSEANVMYKMALIFNDDSLFDLAERMRKAIDNNWQSWIKEDGSYHYSMMDSVFGESDYEHITYDDLTKMQEILNKLYGFDDPVLTKIREPKLQWLKDRGITDYYQNGELLIDSLLITVNNKNQ